MLLTPKQAEYLRNCGHRWNMKGGATRSGKTYMDFRWVIPKRIRDRAGLDGLVVILGGNKGHNRAQRAGADAQAIRG